MVYYDFMKPNIKYYVRIQQFNMLLSAYFFHVSFLENEIIS